MTLSKAQELHDYMHAVLLGIMKKLLDLWFGTSRSFDFCISHKMREVDRRAIFKRGNGESGNGGIGERGNRGTGESGNRGTGESGNGGIGERGNRGTGESGNGGIGERGESGNGGIGESGNGGIGESGNIIFPLLKIFKRGNIPYSPF